LANIPEPHSLISDFVSGLSELLKSFGQSAERKTRTLVFISGAGAATFTWTADVDYYFIGAHSASGTEVQISTSGKALLALGTAASFLAGDVLYLTSTTTSSTPPPQHTPVLAGTKLTVQIGAASTPCTVVLEFA
jgi:hypothetical protein